MRHGWTIKFCYRCNRQTSHAIVEADGLKAYICVNQEQHEALYRSNRQGANETLPKLSSTHTGNCRHLHDDGL